MMNGRYWMFGSANRDQMVERFVEGRMNDAELARFYTMLESDPALRRMVETERAIRGTLMRDRNRLPSDDPRGRAHLMAMLAAMPNGIESAAAGAETAAQHSTSPQNASFLSNGIAKGIAVVVTGGIITVGAIFGIRALDNQTPAAPPVPTVQTHPLNGATLPPAVQTVPDVIDAPSVPEHAMQPQSEPAAAVPATIERPERIAVPSVTRNQAGQSAAVAPLIADSTTTPAATSPANSAHPVHTPVVVIPDTMRVNVMIEMDDAK